MACCAVSPNASYTSQFAPSLTVFPAGDFMPRVGSHMELLSCICGCCRYFPCAAYLRRVPGHLHWLHCLVDVEKLGGEEGELWLLALLLVGQSSLYLPFIRCLASRDKSGVGRLWSVMVEMSSRLGSYGPGSGRAGRPLCYSHVHHTKNLHFKLLSINSLITLSTILNGNLNFAYAYVNLNFIRRMTPEIITWHSFCVWIGRRLNEDCGWRMNPLESWVPPSPFWILGSFLIWWHSNRIILLCDSGRYRPNSRANIIIRSLAWGSGHLTSQL
jgi:hypothetical protein